MKNKSFLVLLLIVTYSLSCKPMYYNQAYNQLIILNCDTCSHVDLVKRVSEMDAKRKTIILINDSILNYQQKFYDLGWSTDIKYKKLEDKLIVDTVDIYHRSIKALNIDEIKFSKDSLINVKTGEKFYTKKFYQVIRIAGYH